MVVAGSGDNMSFVDVIIRNAGYDGMKTTSDCITKTWANNWKVINCQIFNNGLGCPTSVQNGDGIDFTECHDCQVIGTSILNNRGHQIQIKLEARNVTVEYCRIEGNLLFQIGLLGNSPQCNLTALNADSVFFRHNVIFAKGDTSEFIFKLSDVSHLVIENNTIIKDSINFANLGFICFGGCAGGTNWLKTPKSPVVIRNNIFANMSAPFTYGPDTSLFDPFNSVSTQVKMNYNLFYDINGSITTPPDFGINSLVSNPLWCNYPSNLNLQSASKCINAGDPVSPNDPDNSRNDIGAFYYSSPCNVGISSNVADKPYVITFPNPSHGKFTISLQKINRQSEFEIYNVLGEKIYNRQIDNAKTEIDISKQPKGIYFYCLSSPEKVLTGKLIIE